MSQHDFNISNQTFSATRTDLNNAFGALATNSAGNSSPATTYSSQWWFDSDGNQLYIRNKDNDAWVKVFTIGATSDKIDSIADSISIASTGGVTITVTDNSDTLTLKSTDDDTAEGPVLKFTRDPSGVADGDLLGTIKFVGDDAGGNATDYFELQSSIGDEGAGSEDGRLTFYGMVGGTARNVLDITHSNIVFNQDSQDIDFRVESNGNTHMLFVDAGNNRVGINTSSPDTTLQVGDGSAQTRVRIMSPNDNSSVIDFADPDDGNVGSIAYHHGDTEMIFRVADVDQHKFKAGEVVFNEASADVDFRVESNGNANTFFVNGGTDRVGVGTNAPAQTMHIKSTGNPSNDVGLILQGAATDSNCALYFYNSAGTEKGRILYDTDDSFMQFQVNANERMRINNHGHLKVITTGSYISSTQFHEMTNDDGSQQTLFLRHTDSNNPYGLQMEFSAASPDDNTHWLFLGSDNAAVRFRVMSDGDVQNHDNAYGSISDERIKQDIRDSNSQWEDIKAVKVRNFKKKDDVRQYGDNAWEQIGVVAQELEAVSPKLIRHNNPNASDILSDSSFGTLWTADDVETQDAVLYTSDDQEVIDGNKNVGDIKTPSTKQIGDVKEIKEQVKSVNYSILYMKAIKALQEAMDRIETLELKVATLEGE